MRKNNRSALCALRYAITLIAIVFMAGCAKKEIKNLGAQGKTIVCFGDSITFGYGVSLGEDYPSALSKLVSYPVINAGIDGDTTFDALKRLPQDVLAKEPFLVIVEFSGNDFLKKVTFEDTKKNTREIVRILQDKGIMVAIADVSAGPFLREYRTALRVIADETGAIFIPATLTGIITNPSMKSDFLHPNVSGYKVIAQRIYQKIKPYLRAK
jgi:lysophospholipase L1-like esterase